MAPIFERRIVAGGNDVEQRASGALAASSSDLELVTDGGNVQTVGLRFTGLDIPQGAVITRAYIQFKTDEVSTGAASLVIRGQDSDTAAGFSGQFSVSSRPTTDASTGWMPANWTVVGATGAAQRTPDLTAAVQEIVSRQGWKALNSMAFIISGTGTRTAEAFEGDAAGAPLLHIEYSPPTGSAAPILDLDRGAAGRGYATTFHENGAAVAVAGPAAITDVDSTTLTGATVTLTNPQTGDALSVAGLPAGIVVNTAATTASTVVLSGSASLAGYAAALQAVRFANSAETPAAVNRLASVTVTDGQAASNVATATISIDRAPDAVSDRATTTEGKAITLAGLLANDDLGDTPTVITRFDATGTEGGSIAAGNNGALVYTPAAGFTGTDTFTYTIADQDGDTSTGVVSVAVGATDAVRFAAFGDWADGPGTRAVANLIETMDVDFIITTGDNIYDPAESIDSQIGRIYSNYIGNYSGSFGSGSPVNRFFPTLGNHDYAAMPVSNYLNYFTLPGNERYYDFVSGPVHFFAINSNSPERDGATSTSVQAQWLQNGLSNSNSLYNIVYFHHAAYSSGNHGSSTRMQWDFEDWGATAVLTGHDHIYERILRDDDGDGDTLPYFVTGLGGHSRYGLGAPVAGSQVRYAADYGTMVVEASNSAITFEFWSIAGGGRLIDSYTIGLPNSVMLAPSDLATNDSAIHEEQTFDDSDVFQFSPVADPLGSSRAGLASKDIELASATDGNGESDICVADLGASHVMDDRLIEIAQGSEVWLASQSDELFLT